MANKQVNQAIESIEEILNTTLNYDESIDYELTSCDFDWLETAKKALEKQIPKKPLVIKYDEDVKLGAVTWRAGVPVYQCSHCNSFISRPNDFCSKCGNAIDWSGNNEIG